MAYRTIKVKKYSDVIEEIVASAAVTPGMLLVLENTGKVKAHAAADKDAIPMFALEDELQGKGIDDAYASGDPVQVWFPYRGDMVYAILADGQNVAIGDMLVSNGDGTLKKHVSDAEASGETLTVYPLQIVGQALEAVDLSGSSGEEESGALGYDKRILIRVV